jgi:predicted ATP-dependent serine protease
MTDDEIKNPIEIKHTWTIAELLDTDFPEIQWVIPDLIPSGLTILGGRPKVGKSWLMLQIAGAVGSGGKFFEKDIVKGSVFYLAYEDGPRRLKDRIAKLGIPRDADIKFERKWRPLQKGGLDDLVIEMAKKDYRLIVIDTLTRAIPGVDQDAAPIIGPITAQLQTMATDRNLGMVLNDHMKKPTGFSGDPIDDILNSTAKTANADAILAI